MGVDYANGLCWSAEASVWESGPRNVWEGGNVGSTTAGEIRGGSEVEIDWSGPGPCAK